MLKKSTNVVSVLLSEESFQIAQLKKVGSTFRVINLANHLVKGLAEAELIKVIQSSTSGFAVRSSDVVCVLPSGVVTTKNIEIPSVNEDEIRSIVNLQAGRHTPFSREEIQIGYINIGVFKANYTRVLLVIANKGLIKNQVAVFEKAGLKIKHVMFAPEGVAQIYRNVADAKGAGNPVGLVDLGERATEFFVVQGGKGITVRNIPIGRSQIEAEGASAKDFILDELHKTLESYQAEDVGAIPKKYLMAEDDEMAKALQDGIATRLGWDVESAPYVDAIKFDASVLKKMATKYSAVSFLSVLAPVFNTSATPIDLFPEEVQLQKSIAAQGKEVMKTAVLVLILMMTIVIFFVLKSLFMASFLENLKKNYDFQRKEVSLLQEQGMRAKLVENFSSERMLSLDVLKELNRNIPEEVYITALNMNEDGTIDMQGVADTVSIVFNLGTTLKESLFFESVEIKSTASKKDRGKDVAAFEISLKVKTIANQSKGSEE